MARRKATHYKIRFTVEGKGTFPLDMLRFDSCVPTTETEVAYLKVDDYRAPRRVELVRFALFGGEAYPTFARWESFGWKVVDGSILVGE